MGYHTYFDGKFELNKPLTKEHAAYLKAFNSTRRMQRDPAVAEKMDDPIRVAAGLPIGEEGGYFVGNREDFGQKRDDSIVNYNSAPAGQPGLWCQWTPGPALRYGEDRDEETFEYTCIEWDGGEKFYEYVEWLLYIIEHFLKPWGYVLNGTVSFQGEESDDRGAIVCEDNVVRSGYDEIISYV